MPTRYKLAFWLVVNVVLFPATGLLIIPFTSFQV